MGGAGLFRALVLFGLLCFGLLAMFVKLAGDSYQQIIIGGILFSILSMHLKRKDKEFMNINAPFPPIVFFVEYFLLSLPLILALIYYQLWIYLLFVLMFLIIVSFINFSAKKSGINSVFQRIIPDNNFEWKAGVRRYYFLFVGVWIAGFASSYFMAGVPIAIFVLGVLVISFYEKSESLQLLLANELGAGKFLAFKMRMHLSAFTILIVPLVLAYIVFNPQYYYIPLVEFLIFVILLIYTILLKYAFYRPDADSSAIQVFSMIGIVCLFVPVFLPIVLLLSIKFFFRAKQNLNFHLDDFN